MAELKKILEDRMKEAFPDIYERNEATGIIKRKKDKLVSGSDLPELVKDTVAIKLAKAEGKNPTASTIKKNRKRLGIEGKSDVSTRTV
jgi:hypothetical protein